MRHGLRLLHEDEARDIVKQKVSELLSARKRNYDEASIVSSIAKISHTIADSDVRQLDINPMVANYTESYVVDARIVLSPS